MYIKIPLYNGFVKDFFYKVKKKKRENRRASKVMEECFTHAVPLGVIHGQVIFLHGVRSLQIQRQGSLTQFIRKGAGEEKEEQRVCELSKKLNKMCVISVH